MLATPMPSCAELLTPFRDVTCQRNDNVARGRDINGKLKRASASEPRF